MTEQYTRTEEQKAKELAEKNFASPLYGDRVKTVRRVLNPDVTVLHEPEILAALEKALEVYERALSKHHHSALTINSYSSAVNRFIDFLRIGDVVPDMNRRETNHHNKKSGLIATLYLCTLNGVVSDFLIASPAANIPTVIPLTINASLPANRMLASPYRYAFATFKPIVNAIVTNGTTGAGKYDLNTFTIPIAKATIY